MNPVATELTTAGTDLILAVLGVGAMLWLAKRVPGGPRARLWRNVLALVAVSAFLGALVHGFTWGPTMHRLIWAGILLGLSLTAALFPIAALLEVRGAATAHALFPWALGAALVAFGLSQAAESGLVVLLLFGAASAVFSMVLFTAHGLRSGDPGGLMVAAALLLNLLASGIVSRGQARLNLFWPLDHNGVAHLIQMVALGFLVYGVQRMSYLEHRTADLETTPLQSGGSSAVTSGAP